MQEQEPNSVHLTSFPVSTSPNSHYSEIVDPRHHRQDTPSADFHESANLDARARDHQRDSQHHQYEPPPIGVDFTGYQIDPRQRPSSRGPQQQPHYPLPSIRDPPARSSPDSQRTLSPFPGSSSRKRSFSDAHLEKSGASTNESGRTNRLSSISSILNPTRRAPGDDMPIDPSLSAIGQQPRRQSQILQVQHHQLPPPPPEVRLRNVAEGDPGGWDRLERKARLRREADQIREMLKAKERELEELGGDG